MGKNKAKENQSGDIFHSCHHCENTGQENIPSEIDTAVNMPIETSIPAKSPQMYKHFPLHFILPH
jgi:hypothetical protein